MAASASSPAGRSPRGCGRVALALLALVATRPTRADRVELADGRVLDGRFVKLAGVAVDPLQAEAAAGETSEPIL
ncbi:MAG: hypothetical protein FJ275_12880, partial [Planctomycetes bacterium]|nr:hypothetical protein [Planctomycetota bacterium]